MIHAFPMEVEGKYRVAEPSLLFERLEAAHATFEREEQHRDTYLCHPCRDFRITDEALRIRRVNDVPWVTYKGPRMHGSLKVRSEIELRLGDDVASWMEFWQALGFESVHDVTKKRRVYCMLVDGRKITVTVDHIVELGHFAEIECIVHTAEELRTARSDIEQVSLRLGLDQVEKRSYLSMLLEIDR
jgi:adenylate cyclase, class 2